jgi:hypothetical protein
MNRALIIKKEHLDNIFDNGKIWEMRSQMTNVRGEIGLIESGSGMIVGKCEIVDCQDLSHLSANLVHKWWHKYHKVDDLTALKKWNKALLIKDAVRFDKPIPYDHPQGAVIWVKIEGLI